MSKANLSRQLLTRLSGQQAIIGVPRVYIELTGNHVDAVVLSQLVYWQGSKDIDEWFYKTDEELCQECCVTVKQLSRIRDALAPFGVESQRMGMPAKMHYRVNMDTLLQCVTSCYDLSSVQTKGIEHVTTKGIEHVTTERSEQSIYTKNTQKTTTEEAEEEVPSGFHFNQPKAEKTTWQSGGTRGKVEDVHRAPGEAHSAANAQFREAYEAGLKRLGKSSPVITTKDSAKIDVAIPMYGTHFSRLKEYAVWLAESWTAIRTGNEEFFDKFEVFPLFLLTSEFYYGRYFTKFLEGGKIAVQGGNLNAKADARYQREKETLLQGTANAEYMDL